MENTFDLYRYNMEMCDGCERIALSTDDLDMKLFWHNASVGFRERALNMPVYYEDVL